jgi:hypothetical protein
VRALPGASLSPQGVLRAPLPPGAEALQALGELIGHLEGDARAVAAPAV